MKKHKATLWWEAYLAALTGLLAGGREDSYSLGVKGVVNRAKDIADESVISIDMAGERIQI